MHAKKKVAKKVAASKPAKPVAKKAPAKPVKKTASKPTPKAKSVKSVKAPAKKPVAKAPAKPAKKAVPSKSHSKKPAPKAAAKKAAPKKPVAKTAAKKPSKPAPSILKKTAPAPTMKSSPPAKAAKPAHKPAAKAPVKKEVPKSAPKKEAAKAVPAPVKEVKPQPAPAPVKAVKPVKTGSKSSTPSVALPTKNFNAGPPIKSVSRTAVEAEGATIDVKKSVKMTPFLKKQKARLLELRSMLLDNMDSVAEGSLRTRPEGSEASAFGMHQADAGSDAYDRDFALSLLSQEQDSLYEINEALKRIDLGIYGICEMSSKPIPEIRLEALPFARFTVECQAKLEREGMGGRHRRPVRSLFGLEDAAESDSDSDDDEETETVDKKEE